MNVKHPLSSLHSRSLFRNRSAQHLRPEEGTFGLLDNSLVYTLRGMIHDHCSRFVVDLCIDLCISNEVDDPFLTL